MGFSRGDQDETLLSKDKGRRKNLAEINDPCSAPLIRLHNEILSFCDKQALTEKEKTLRYGVVEMESICRELWGDLVQVHMFGSQATGTANKFSDIDLTVLGCDCPVDDTTSALVAIADIIKERDLATYLEIIPNAKVPIIKMDHKASGLSLDICCNETSGIEAASLVLAFSEDYAPFKYLTMVMKSYLARRHLHETYFGRYRELRPCCNGHIFHSAAASHSCLHRQPKLESGLSSLDFLDLYGCTLNYNKVVLSLRDGGSYQ